MFSITFRRSAATLGVVAGLLAAAAPASAQILDGPVLAKAGSSEGVKAPVPASCLVDFQPGVCYFHTVKPPANAMSAGISGNEMSEAVKAPATPTSEVFTSVSNVTARRLQGGIVPGGAIISALNDVEAIDFNALGTQVGSEGVKAPKAPASSEEPLESISFNYLKAAGTETGNPER